MFKKLILVGMIMVGLTACSGEKTETHSYVITSVNGNNIDGEIIGVPKPDNYGIFLYQKDLKEKLKVGDKIKVTFTKGILDDILNVEKVD